MQTRLFLIKYLKYICKIRQRSDLIVKSKFITINILEIVLSFQE